MRSEAMRFNQYVLLIVHVIIGSFFESSVLYILFRQALCFGCLEEQSVVRNRRTAGRLQT
jgi:hypothetical protein